VSEQDLEIVHVKIELAQAQALAKLVPVKRATLVEIVDAEVAREAGEADRATLLESSSDALDDLRHTLFCWYDVALPQR